jgi:F420-dependent oxidoreductase-like protein
LPVVRIGLMVGPERGHHREKADKLAADAAAAEAAGFASVWVPQIPNDFDALTAITLMAAATSRIELGTAVMVLQTRHPIALAQQALSTQAVCGGRLTLGLGPSHHWIIEDMLGLAYEQPARFVRDYLEVLATALAAPGPVDVENETFRVHNPLDISDLGPTPILLAALGPVMLRVAGEHAAGTILWMADERAIGDHIVPRITKAAEEAGRPAPRVVAGIPVTLCAPHEVEDARARATRILAEAEHSPNYQRLLEQGDARDVGDLLAAGDEASVVARLARFRDAGATDLSVRIVPIGPDREARLASWHRTEAFLGGVGAQL